MFMLIIFQIRIHTIIKNVQVSKLQAKQPNQDNKKKTTFTDFKISVPQKVLPWTKLYIYLDYEKMQKPILFECRIKNGLVLVLLDTHLFISFCARQAMGALSPPCTACGPPSSLKGTISEIGSRLMRYTLRKQQSNNTTLLNTQHCLFYDIHPLNSIINNK